MSEEANLGGGSSDCSYVCKLGLPKENLNFRSFEITITRAGRLNRLWD